MKRTKRPPYRIGQVVACLEWDYYMGKWRVHTYSPIIRIYQNQDDDDSQDNWHIETKDGDDNQHTYFRALNKKERGECLC